MMDTNALNPSTLGSGKSQIFSILGKDTSTTPIRFFGFDIQLFWWIGHTVLAGDARFAVQTPYRHEGARLWILSPSCDATQPPTPMTKFGFLLSFFQRPSSENTFSCAFHTEQVFMSRTSASSGIVRRYHAMGVA